MFRSIPLHSTPGSRDAVSHLRVSEGRGSLLLNRDGERFVDELLPRDVVTEAIQKQMEKDGTDHVWLSMAPIPREKILSHFPNIYRLPGGGV